MLPRVSDLSPVHEKMPAGRVNTCFMEMYKLDPEDYCKMFPEERPILEYWGYLQKKDPEAIVPVLAP